MPQTILQHLNSMYTQYAAAITATEKYSVYYQRVGRFYSRDGPGTPIQHLVNLEISQFSVDNNHDNDRQAD